MRGRAERGDASVHRTPPSVEGGAGEHDVDRSRRGPRQRPADRDRRAITASGRLRERSDERRIERNPDEVRDADAATDRPPAEQRCRRAGSACPPGLRRDR